MLRLASRPMNRSPMRLRFSIRDLLWLTLVVAGSWPKCDHATGPNSEDFETSARISKYISQR